MCRVYFQPSTPLVKHGPEAGRSPTEVDGDIKDSVVGYNNMQKSPAEQSGLETQRTVGLKNKILNVFGLNS